jgi:hypothetical protein
VIHRLYTWEVLVPAGRTPESVLQAAQEAAERVAQYNPNVEGTEVFLTAEGALRATVHYTGRDQWWIKKKIVYAIMGILTQSDIPLGNAKLIAVGRPEDQRSKRERASDGRHNPLPDDQDIDHRDMGLAIT